MANHLKVAKVLSIQALHAQGWSQRQITRELGINRETVARLLRKAAESAEAPTEGEDSKPATAPTGSSGESPEPKPAKAPTGSDAEKQQRTAETV